MSPPAALLPAACAARLGFYCLLWITAVVKETSCLRLLEMKVPSAVIQGRSMWLNCTYDLESDELYSVKWYKNDTEFYRYIPRDRPPAQNYDLPGVVVDMVKSREGNVFVAAVNLSTEGNYRCEASAEAPSFQTVVGEREVKVFVIPDQRPTIHGTRAKYNVGDRVDVICKAPFSLPGAKLVWLVNDEEAMFHQVREYESLFDVNGLQSTSLGLSFEVRPKHLASSALKLKCVSVISEVFLMSSEEFIVGDTVPSIPYPETSPNSPTIEGGLPKYRINDLVNLTCRSAEYDEPPELMWYINDKEARQEYLVRRPLQRYPKFLATLGLFFRVRPEHFEDERMHLRCTATLSHVVNISTAEKTISNDHRSSGFRASDESSNEGISLWTSFFSSLLVCFVVLEL
ncbi:uncharacterized protein LOC8042731 [Ixodes scapularis]|nr:uncharacterized protein LOC8042731 [Ixodes scapularis]